MNIAMFIPFTAFNFYSKMVRLISVAFDMYFQTNFSTAIPYIVKS